MANQKFNAILLTKDLILNEELILAEGVLLQGLANVKITFSSTDGIVITKDNIIKDLNIHTSDSRRAIRFNARPQGSLLLENIKTKGMISLINEDDKDLSVIMRNVHVLSSDSAMYGNLPHGYNVDVLLGAVTLYNLSPRTTYSGTLEMISIGLEDAPVFGSGVFVSGTDHAKINIESIITKEIYVDSKIPNQTPGLISGGVFPVKNAFVKNVVQVGTSKTWGNNAMVLDTWGQVKNWCVNGDVLSEGPSSIGFVNFGLIDELYILGNIITKGVGSRGFNNYDGTIKKLIISIIETFGDGAVGFQISKPLGNVFILGDIHTHGSTGLSLVKGEMKELSAHAISVLEEGSANSFILAGEVNVDDPSFQAIVNKGNLSMKKEENNLT